MAESSGKKVVLGLYQDTQGCTAILLDAGGRLLGRSYAMVSQHRPQPGWVEYDPYEIWHRSWQSIEQVCKATGVARREVAALGITTQQGTVIVWERASGRPLAPAISWRCQRTAEICQTLRASGQDALIRERSGGLLDTTTAGPKLRWLLEHIPGLRERALRGEVCAGTVDSWLLWNLTGGAVHATDRTNASDTLLFNLHTHDWDEDLLALFSVPRSILPEVHPSGHAYGCLAAEPVPITALCADPQAGLFGLGCLEPGWIKATYGRDAIVMMDVGPTPPDTAGQLRTAAAPTLEGESPRFVLEGRVLTAGLVIEWLRDELALIPTVADSEMLAHQVPDSGGVYVIPAFQGLGAPYWLPHLRGGIVGLGPTSSRAQIVRAALEGLAYRVRDIVEAIRRWSGREVHELRADGGAAANNFLLQFQADILGIPVRRHRFIHAAATGIALLAGRQAGLWADMKEVAGPWPEERLFTPSMPEATRQALYQGWREALERLIAR
ncbi:MAG: FGGY family carbohydrate kinase [Chloroflexia bacterium]